MSESRESNTTFRRLVRGFSVTFEDLEYLCDGIPWNFDGTSDTQIYCDDIESVGVSPDACAEALQGKVFFRKTAAGDEIPVARCVGARHVPSVGCVLLKLEIVPDATQSE